MRVHVTRVKSTMVTEQLTECVTGLLVMGLWRAGLYVMGNGHANAWASVV